MEAFVEGLRGNLFFSLLDLKSGYWQCPLTEKANRLLGMITTEGTFKWFVVPFGVKNAPAYFQRVMTDILKGGIGNYCFVYIDDIVVFSATFEEHLLHLALVLQALQKSNLKVNIDKCHFSLKQLRLLGKIVNGEGVTTDPDLVKDLSLIHISEPT